MGVKVELKDNTGKKIKNLSKGMTDAFTDVVLDAKRVSSESAPHKTGHLEKNRYSIVQTRGGLEGYVGFEARSKKGFDYADWTHEANYNLGEQSKRKRGGRSKYGNGVIPVGRQYLANTIRVNAHGYYDHFRKAYKDSIEK